MSTNTLREVFCKYNDVFVEKNYGSYYDLLNTTYRYVVSKFSTTQLSKSVIKDKKHLQLMLNASAPHVNYNMDNIHAKMMELFEPVEKLPISNEELLKVYIQNNNEDYNQQVSSISASYKDLLNELVSKYDIAEKCKVSEFLETDDDKLNINYEEEDYIVHTEDNEAEEAEKHERKIES